VGGRRTARSSLEKLNMPEQKGKKKVRSQIELTREKTGEQARGRPSSKRSNEWEGKGCLGGEKCVTKAGDSFMRESLKKAGGAGLGGRLTKKKWGNNAVKSK